MMTRDAITTSIMVNFAFETGLTNVQMIGLSADAANDYAKTVVAAEFGGAGDADVVRKVMGDLAAKDVAITEAEIRAKMDELMTLAVTQVKAGT